MKNLLKRIAHRLIAGIGVLWGAATLTFIAVNVTGGDTALAIVGGANAITTTEVLASVRAEYGLDKSLAVQYADYLLRIAQGDLGESYRLRIPVTKAILQQLGSTIELALWGASVAIVLAVAVALSTAGRSRKVQSWFSGVELVLSSIPGFVKGLFLLLVFSFQLHWLPSSGAEGWRSLVLPVLTLAIPLATVLTQVLRQELEDVLEQPFITMARARGLSDAAVRLVHALRHALIPLVTLSGFILASLLGGAAIVETLFVRRGIGRLMVESTSNKDIPLVLGITLLSALIYVVVNLVVDILNALIDPRVVHT